MNILDAAGTTGFAYRKMATTNGGEYAGTCPECGGMDRFRVWPADKGGGGSYWCRGCGKGGDLVQFLVDFCNYGYRDAFKAAGRGMPDNYKRGAKPGVPAVNSPRKEFEPRVYEAPVETWCIKAQAFVEKSNQSLLTYDHGLKYLESRGLDLAAVKAFKLGWFAGEKGKICAFRPRNSWGLENIKNPKTGRNKMLWIPRGFVIPCFKEEKVYRIRIRRPKADLQQDRDVKYYVLPGSGMEADVTGSDKQAFVVVESDLDGKMITRKAGSLTGVVTLGSAATKPGSSVFYVLKKALRVLVALDFDRAGIGAWKWWNDNFENAIQWPVPMGKDPGEAFENGVDIKLWVKAGLPPVLTIGNRDTCYQIPEGLSHLEELELLLKKYPIELVADEDKAVINFDPGFRNNDIRERVRSLFFGDDEVFHYLKLIHPESVIHGGNFNFNRAI